MEIVKRYFDVIVQEDDLGGEHEVWRNAERDSRWGHDNDPDSEYHEMMRLDAEYDFCDWDRDDLPTFVHYVYMQEYKRYADGRTVKSGEPRIVSTSYLVDEYMNT